MNAYFTACTEAIEEAGGTLDKYIGDAVVAMFGAPVHLPDHALQACVAALKIQDQIADLREKFRRDERKWPNIVHGLRVTIGLNSGRAIVGNMGTATRFSYTMMGDEVNLAARMESGQNRGAFGHSAPTPRSMPASGRAQVASFSARSGPSW